MFIYILLLTLSTVPYFITTGGLIDHGFDSALVAGSFPDWTFSGSGSFLRDTDDKYDGDSCAVITATTSGNNYFHQDLTATGLIVGKTYYLSLRYKILDGDLTVGSGGGVRVQLAIHGGAGDGTVYAATKPQIAFSRDRWQTVQLAFTARTENSRLSVGMWSAAGRVAIDDVRINVMEEQDGAAIVNPDFEPFGASGSAPFGWTTELHSGTITTVNDDYISGSAAVQISRASSGTTKLTQIISIPDGKSLAYAGQLFVKTAGVGSGGAKLRIYQTVEGGTQDIYTSPLWSGSSEWLRVPFSFKTLPDGSDLNQLTLEFSLADTGSVRFDALELRLVALQATDFDQDDWGDYWKISGAGQGELVATTGGKYKLHFTQTEYGTSVIKQSFDAIPGLPYMLWGTISSELVAPAATEDPSGLFIQIYDRGKEQIISEEGPLLVTSSGHFWSLDLYPDFMTGISAGRYELRFLLKNCSGHLDIVTTGVTIPSVDTESRVIPQPLSIKYNSSRIQELGAEGSTWYLVYPDDPDLPEEPDHNPGFRCVWDLATDLAGGRLPNKTAYTYYFHIGESKIKAHIIKLSQFDPDIQKPALVIGEVASTPTATPPYPDFENYLVARGFDPAAIGAMGAEGYLVDVPVGANPVMLLVSSGAVGRYYATQTFLQLIEKGGSNQYYLPEVTVWDKPDSPVRAAFVGYPREYLHAPEKLGFGAEQYRKCQYKADWLLPNKNLPPLADDERPPMEVYIRLLSRLKINQLTFESPIFYCLQEASGSRGADGEMLTNLQLIKPFFEYCRKYYINPVPKMQSFGHGYAVLQFLPTEVECCWVGGDATGTAPREGRIDSPMPQPWEEVNLNASRRHILGYQMVVITEDRPLKVQTGHGELTDWHDLPQTDAEGNLNWWLEYNPIDFDFVSGYTTTAVSGGSGYYNCAINFSERLDPGYVYRISYHHVNTPRLIPTDSTNNGYDTASFSYCPSSVAVHRFMSEKIDQVVGFLHPTLIDFGHDEPWQVHTCEKCYSMMDVEVHARHEVHPDGLLYGRDINFIVKCYKEAAENHGMDPDSVHGIFMADHLSQPHEENKVPPPFLSDGEENPDWRLWWDFRGRRYKLGVYNMNAYLNNAKWLVKERYPDTILLDWALHVDTQDEALGKTYHAWDKWTYVEDLTRAGFAVLGGSAGYSYYANGTALKDDPHFGAVVRAKLYSSMPALNPVEFDLPLLLDLEGSYEQSIALSFNNTPPDESGRAWFSYRYPNFTGYHHENTPTGTSFDRAEFTLDIVGERAEGQAWVDDAELYWNYGGITTSIIRPPSTGITAIRNGGFEDSGSGGQVFTDWENPTDPTLASARDGTIFRNLYGNQYSCHITKTDLGPESANPTGHSVWQSDMALSRSIPGGSTVNIRAFLRTHKMDTLRLWCPWQWAKCGSDFRSTSLSGGRWLGGLNFSWAWAGEMLPRVDIFNRDWKFHVADVAVSEFNWRWRTKDQAYRLKNLLYDPFMIFEKEVPW